MLLAIIICFFFRAWAQCPPSCLQNADCNVCGNDAAFGIIFQPPEPRFWVCVSGACQITAAWVQDGTEEGIAALDRCSARSLPDTTISPNLCCYSDADNSQLTTGAQIALTDPLEMCSRKRCRLPIGCSTQGVCQYDESALRVDAPCCLVDSDCPHYSEIEDDVSAFEMQCFEANCVANTCVYSAASECCLADADCDSAGLGLAQCERYFCNPDANQCQRRTVEGCSCSADDQCGDVAVDPCHTPLCSNGACTTAPDLILGTAKPGCCAAAETALADCNAGQVCDAADGCSTSTQIIGAFTYAPVYSCQFKPTSQSGCCSTDSPCSQLSQMSECVASACDTTINQCQLNDVTPGGVPCCYELADCYDSCAGTALCDANGIPADRCGYYTCVGGTETANASTFSCQSNSIANCSPGTELPSLTVDTEAAAGECTWQCDSGADGDADTNMVSVIATFSPIERPIYEYEMRVVVDATGGPQAVTSVDLISLGAADPSPVFVEGAPVDATLSYTARFTPQNFAPIDPGSVLRVEALVEFDFSSTVTQYGVRIVLEPRNSCTAFFFGVGQCTAATVGSVLVEPTHTSALRLFVFDGVVCSEQCDTPPDSTTAPTGTTSSGASTTSGTLVATPAPTPDPSGVVSTMRVAVVACQFDCDSSSPVNTLLNHYDIGLRRNPVSPFTPTRVVFLQSDATLYHRRLAFYTPITGQTRRDAFPVPSVAGLGFTVGLGEDRDLPSVTCSQTADCNFVLVVPLNGTLAVGEFSVVQIFENVECQQYLVDLGGCASFQLGQIVATVAVRQEFDFDALGCTTEPCGPPLALNVALGDKEDTRPGTLECDWECGSGVDENTIRFVDLCMVNTNDVDLPISNVFIFDDSSFDAERLLLTPDGGLATLVLYPQSDPTQRSVYRFDEEFVGFVNRFGIPGASLVPRPTIPANSEACYTVEFSALTDEVRDEVITLQIFCAVPCNGLYRNDASDICQTGQEVDGTRYQFTIASFGTTALTGCSEQCERSPPLVTTGGQFVGVVWVDENADELFQQEERRVPSVVVDLYSITNATVVAVASSDTQGVYSATVPPEFLFDGVVIQPRVRPDTIPLDFELQTRAEDLDSALFSSAVSPSTNRGFRVTLSAQDDYATSRQNVGIVRSPPCTPNQPPYVDDQLVLRFDEVLSSDCLVPRLLSCADDGVSRTAELRLTLTNFGAFAIPARSVEIRSTAIGALVPEHMLLEKLTDSDLPRLLPLESLVAGAAHAAFYFAPLASGESVSVATVVSYCAAIDVPLNVTAFVYGDACLSLVDSWVACAPDVDPRECYAQRTLETGLLSCPARPTTTSLGTAAPTPPPGQLSSSPFEFTQVPFECAGGAACINDKLLARLENSSLAAECTTYDRSVMRASILVKNARSLTATTTLPFTLVVSVSGVQFGSEGGAPEIFYETNGTVVLRSSGQETLHFFNAGLPPNGTLEMLIYVPQCGSSGKNLTLVTELTGTQCFDVATCTLMDTSVYSVCNGGIDTPCQLSLADTRRARLSSSINHQKRHRAVGMAIVFTVAALIICVVCVLGGVYMFVRTGRVRQRVKQRKNLPYMYTKEAQAERTAKNKTK